ncbi:MAG: RNA 2',3'-cyclic phosphodiesterase [Candidatus Micrarchaeota archaeon]|nr:RNA 2',3'-cyclic phosphodiesterase [Candidatus Micrarchaeota archaeon]
MRAFIAVEVSEELKKRIATLQAELPEGLSLVKPGNMHLTLHFFGEIDENSKNKIIDAMNSLPLPLPAFDMKFSGLGVFPSESYVRVVWVGCESPGLLGLAREFSLKLSALGFKTERFTPHLTIARVKNKADFGPLLKKYQNYAFGVCDVGSLILKKSTLTPNGPVYEDVYVRRL